jgi:hypothetical protein
MDGMSAYGVSLMTSVHSSFTQELSVAHATQAAEAGMEWARLRITRNLVPTCPGLCRC